jgi:NhaA family Na+:H+ antiporter
MECIDNLDHLTTDVRSPLQHLEHKLHNLTAYFILPVFAFANAGVVLSTNSGLNTSLMLSITISLFVGKLLGVSLFSYLGVKLKLTELPTGINFKQIIGIASIAGVGFTMSIFIANLAFGNDLVNINSSKVGIIIGSIISGVVGVVILRLTSKKEPENTTTEQV